MSEPKTLERALARLEEITISLEGGNSELDESLALYEEGIRLIRVAEDALRAAEMRIERIHEDGTIRPIEGGEPKV